MNRPHPIAAHRLLGDGHTAALLRPDGEIDWWCAPRLDGPPLLWSLLDADNGARWRDRRATAAGGDARPAGPTARTLLRCWDGGRFEALDGLLEHDGAPVLVRLVRALDGPLDITCALDLGGFDGPWLALDGPAVRVSTSGGELPRDGELRLRAGRGAWAGVAVAVGAAAPPPPPDRLRQRLEEMQAEADANGRSARLPRALPRRAEDALAVLAACTDAVTGAPVAAVTTSLPEVAGGNRQFDYRYSWLRDASLALSTAALLGRTGLAARHLAFLREFCKDGMPRVPVTDVRGERVPDEREVGGVAGWADSRPVRVGDSARGPAAVRRPRGRPRVRVGARAAGRAGRATVPPRARGGGPAGWGGAVRAAAAVRGGVGAARAPRPRVRGHRALGRARPRRSARSAVAAVGPAAGLGAGPRRRTPTGAGRAAAGRRAAEDLRSGRHQRGRRLADGRRVRPAPSR